MRSPRTATAPTSDTLPTNLFADVPRIIEESGRVRGFEALRDLLLNSGTALVGPRNILALVKLVLETDRHALFAEVAEARVRTHQDKDRWDYFQKYLEGGVESFGVPSSIVPGAGGLRVVGEDESKEDSAEETTEERR